MKGIGSSAVFITTSVIVIAGIAIVVAKNYQSVSVVRGFSNFFDRALQTTVSPITGDATNNDNTFQNPLHL